MKLKFAQVAAATALAAGAVFAPIAAQASTYPAPPTGTVGSGTVAAGGTVSFGVPADSFEPGEPVSISVTGEGAAGASLAIMKFAPSTQSLGTVTANSSGSIAPVSIRFPATAVGPQTITATSPSNPLGVSATVTVTAAGAAAGGGSGVVGGSNGRGLAVTGFNSSEMLGLWVGGGALVLAGGGIVAASAVRRNRKLAASN